MVMTLFLYLLSHYNSISEPRARFLLSLIEDLTINFPSHFILSLMDVYRDMTTCDKLIFVSAITRIIRHASVSYPESTHFSIIGAISGASIRWSEAQLRPKRSQTETTTPSASSAPSTSLLLLPRVVWPLRQSWRSFSAWMLVLIHSLLSCVKWTPVLVVLHDDRLTLLASQSLPLLLHRHLRTRTMMVTPVMIMMMRMRMLALLMTMRWLLHSDLPFVIVIKRGSSFGYESSHLLRGRVSIGHFC